MKNKKPPFEITRKILALITDIAELVGRISSTEKLSSNPNLRRTNRIKTIYSSLAIEQNTLSLDQVTAVIAGKHVIAPPRDIAEVKNAYEIYDCLDNLDAYSADDMLKAHSVMMKGLITEAGVFRSGNVGVVDKNGTILHYGTLPAYIPKLVHELFDWTCKNELHILIKSCVFHYELELIHPFADGNGRMGRLWHTLLLSKWNPIFAWLPVESIIHDRQKEYYEAINVSNVNGESTVFIEFMLSAIKSALVEAMETERNKSDKNTDERRKVICNYLQNHDYIKNSDVRNLLGVSAATANRILASLTEAEIIEKVHVGRFWQYKLLKK